MMRLNKYIYMVTVLGLLTAVVGCSGRGGKSAQMPSEVADAEVSQVRRFIPALPPATLTEEEHQAYMVEHYWDRFDFADTTFIAEVDTAHMATAFAVYAAGYVPDSLASEAMSRLMAKASISRRMFDYFVMLAEGVLHDPNSPLRDDEKYIPVLEAIVASPYYDEVERLPYEYDLEIARQNRVGHAANDFSYTLESGFSGQMYGIDAEYLLIFFSNPGCPMCRDVSEQIQSSPLMNELVEREQLKVLVVYPDEDLEQWRAHLDEYPPAWLCSYNEGRAIERERLYDMKAIPALYLLDRQKRVMAKDCVDVEQIEHLISEAETN